MRLKKDLLKKFIAGSLVLSLLFLCACGDDTEKALNEAISEEQSGGAEAGANPQNSGSDSLSQIGNKETVNLSLLCVGDVMTHMSHVNAQYNAATGGYDFSNNFEYVKPYIEGADLALCNVETTFGGKPYTGYPGFSGPDELAADLSEAGFDVAMTANNHMYDKRSTGLYRTLELLRAAGMTTTGSRMEGESPRYALNSVNGISVGTVAYTYESPVGAAGVALNGLPVTAADAANINSFDDGFPDQAIADIGGAVRSAKDAGADIVVLYLHWGQEYQLSANSVQRRMAERIVYEIPEVDCIFASHPHNLQEFELIEPDGASASSFEGHGGATALLPREGRLPVPVFYSLGNFISNQRIETLGGDKFFPTEIGAMGRVYFTLEKSSSGASYGHSVRKLGVKADALPTWVDKYTAGGALKYSIIPLDENMYSNPALALSGHTARAERARAKAYELLKL